MPWRTIEGDTLAPAATPQLEVLLRGVFDQRRFLDPVRHFVVFDDDGKGGIAKKLAGYHQYHAVNVAVRETVRATRRTEPILVGEPGGVYRSGRSICLPKLMAP